MNALAFMYVAVGGAVGSMARYLVMSLCGRWFFSTQFPLGTFVVNILGGLLLGMWVATIVYLLPAKGRDLHLLVAVGALGGFTTFSTFTMDLFLLIEKGLAAQAIGYALGSVFLSLGALFAGMWVVKFITA